MAPRTRVLGKLQVIAPNFDWISALFDPVVISRSNYCGIGFSIVIWKPLNCLIKQSK